jgi:hypothetical protein
MKRYITLFFLTAALSGNALADEWIQVGESESIKTFVNNTAVVVNGNWAVMWVLRDYGAPVQVGKSRRLSSISVEEYDCKAKQYRTLSFYWFSQRHGKGKMVYSEIDHDKFRPIIPGSHEQEEWKAACKGA